MPLKAVMIVLSLMLHAAVIDAVRDSLSAMLTPSLELGEAQDIIVAEFGQGYEEVALVGANLDSVAAEEAVSVAEQQAPLSEVAPVLHNDGDVLGETAEPVDGVALAAATQHVTTAIEPTAVPPAGDGDVESKNLVLDPEAVAPVDDVLPPVVLPDQPHDVLSSSVSPVADNLVRTLGSPQAEEIATGGTDASEPSETRAAPVTDQVPGEAPPGVALAESRLIENGRLARAVARETPLLMPDTVVDADQVKLDQVAGAPTQAPIVPVNQETPQLIELISEPDQVVVSVEQSPGLKQDGGNASIVALYFGEINVKVQRSKVNPRSAKIGTVVTRFTVGMDGKLLAREIVSSSGVTVLDDAALLTLDRASPFPPIPANVSSGPLTFTQQFRYVVR